MKRQWDKDGYYTIPKTDNYPGLVARKVSEDHDIVAFGPPELAKEAVDAAFDARYASNSLPTG